MSFCGHYSLARRLPQPGSAIRTVNMLSAANHVQRTSIIMMRRPGACRHLRERKMGDHSSISLPGLDLLYYSSADASHDKWHESSRHAMSASNPTLAWQRCNKQAPIGALAEMLGQILVPLTESVETVSCTKHAKSDTQQAETYKYARSGALWLHSDSTLLVREPGKHSSICSVSAWGLTGSQRDLLAGCSFADGKRPSNKRRTKYTAVVLGVFPDSCREHAKMYFSNRLGYLASAYDVIVLQVGSYI